MAKRKVRSKVSPKSAKARSKQVNAGPKASEEFGGEFYASEDWKRLKKKHPRGFQATLIDHEKREWDDGPAWYAELKGHNKLAKITGKCGRALGEAFGDDMDDWKGRTVHVTPTNYSVGWGAEIDPITDDEEEALVDEDPDLDDDDESID